MNVNNKVTSSIVIHQPHFFAWAPYYCRIASAETFVILDNVSFRRHFYQDRTHILSKNNELIQLNVPNNGTQNMLIKDVQLINLRYFLSKFYKTIYFCFKKYPYFETIFGFLEEEFRNLSNETTILNLNTKSVIFILRILRIDLPVIFSSSRLTSENERNCRIIDICRKTEKNNILCGWGATEQVHDISLMSSFGLRFVSISKEEYLILSKQKELFEGVSIIDTLMRIGIDSTREIFENCLKGYKSRCQD